MEIYPIDNAQELYHYYIENFKTDTGADNAVTAILPSRKGHFWAGIHGDGILRFKNGQFSAINNPKSYFF